MSNYSVTVVDRGGAPVVTDADPVIHVHPDLWMQMRDDSLAVTWHGDVCSIGTEGHGLGVVRYQDMTQTTVEGYRVMHRIET